MQTALPDLASLIPPEELDKLTKEGQETLGDPTPEQNKQIEQMRAQYMQRLAAMNQYRFQAYMQRRPMPLFNRYDPGFVLYRVWCYFKELLSENTEIAPLTEQQWLHGIQSGNIDYQLGEDGIPKDIRVIQPYIGKTIKLKPV